MDPTLIYIYTKLKHPKYALKEHSIPLLLIYIIFRRVILSDDIVLEHLGIKPLFRNPLKRFMWNIKTAIVK